MDRMLVERFRDRSKQFIKEWGTAGLFILIAVNLALQWKKDQAIRAEALAIRAEAQRVVDAKQRIALDREAISETRQKVSRIEERLQFNDVPDRLKRIEEGMSEAVKDNREAIRKVAVTLEAVLGVPREEIVPPVPKLPDPSGKDEEPPHE